LQQQQEEKELQQLIQSKQRTQRSLQNSNQHMPSQQLRTQHQYQRFRLQLSKTRLQMSILVAALCFTGYLGVRYWISLAYVGPMSSYASAFGGGFPPDFGLQIWAIAFFGLLCMTLLERINPDIARRISEQCRSAKNADQQRPRENNFQVLK
jgi:hypothetical protein